MGSYSKGAIGSLSRFEKLAEDSLRGAVGTFVCFPLCLEGHLYNLEPFKKSTWFSNRVIGGGGSCGWGQLGFPGPLKVFV